MLLLVVQECVSGQSYNYFLGYARYHSCVNGAYNTAPLVCGRMCADVQAPIYTQSCTHRWFVDDFNSTRESWTMAKYWTWPTIPDFQRNRIWTWDTTRQLMVANTQEVSACDRLTGAYSHLAYHNARWNSFIAPANNLMQSSTVRIMLLDANSTAGITTRMLDHNNHYRMELRTTGISIVRASGGVFTTIATTRNMT